ncbi:hypothetical protein I8748_11090 [Nostoc sp. CENA67]|uniref:Uncharacterized protein n=1 Tax=Amazonocrinis nigriterrae CENA67 TaxID=2794033 RepID=A0A8J7HNL1_9NOST|nr:hypothetical protein [Amazonocrinis nigriterrae]MBH8562717.1 hypothetical protein [Amazonocrinis nigriterrae CENA67]
MSQIDYTAMSDQELKEYFIKHREDKVALQAYLERRRGRRLEVITTIDDPEFDSKIQAAIRQQISDKQG